MMYLEGRGVVKDAGEAAKWFRKAAEQDFLNAEIHLGKLYYFGDTDLPKNYQEAAKWLAKAVAHGSVWAQNTLGLMHQEGLGVKQDLKKAVNLYQKAAQRGDAKAQSNLGFMYYEGFGVERDLVSAYKWLTLSGNQGEITAVKMRLEVEDRMRPDQITKAQRLADEFKSTN
jgi:TPR repeat protein